MSCCSLPAAGGEHVGSKHRMLVMLLPVQAPANSNTDVECFRQQLLESEVAPANTMMNSVLLSFDVGCWQASIFGLARSAGNNKL